jgi:hypothetical protein
MTPQISLRAALEDPQLLNLGAPSWIAWRSLLLATMGEQLTAPELEHFRKLTGRYKPPSECVAEFWAVIGRRGGKSRAIASLAVYIAALCEHRLARGEVGKVICVAGDREQAGVVLSYAQGLFDGSPILGQLVARSTGEEIELKSGIRIAVHSSSFRRLRGFTGVAAICDEIAFWHSDESANPDSEIITALRPTLATTGGPLIAISSPYARKGEMWEAFNRDYGADGDPAVLVAQGGTLDLNLSGDSRLAAWVKRRYERDPASAAAECGAQFRTDVENFVRHEVLDICTDDVAERLPAPGVSYFGFIDPSGGSADSMTLGIAHREDAIVVLDVVREARPPFAPSDVVEEFAQLLRDYQINRVQGDRYAGLWVAEQFSANGILYEPSELTKSEIYGELLPLLNSHAVALLNDERLRRQLLGLERRKGRVGRDIIDHGRGAHDDLANAAAGALVMVQSAAPAGSPSNFGRPLDYPPSSYF